MKIITTTLFSLAFVLGFAGSTLQGQSTPNLQDQFRHSLVYIESSQHAYDPHRPWKHVGLQQKIMYGCIVGDHKILTVAHGIADAKFIQVRLIGHNALIPAGVHTIDYAHNLCLLTMDEQVADANLQPITFSDNYRKSAEVQSLWLSQSNQVQQGRGFIDQARITKSAASFGKFLNYNISNISHPTGSGQLYCLDNQPIGLAARSNSNNECGLIPAMTINHFLEDLADGHYEGSAIPGFACENLLAPQLRQYLKMPTDLQQGIYVKDVFNLGTASDALEAGDVILAINGQSIDAFGRYRHDLFQELAYQHLINQHPINQKLAFTLWRNGRQQQLEVTTQNFTAAQMAIPYHEYDGKPEYVITGGCVLQKLTGSFFRALGDNWQARASAHLVQYIQTTAYKPTEERKDIVVLNYVLPAPINQGYQQLRQLVVKKFNGMELTAIGDIPIAQKLNPDALYDVIELENENPVIVLDRSQLPTADAQIAQLYGISELVNINTD